MRHRLLLWLSLLAALPLVSCQKETEVARANREKILLVGNGGEPQSLDLHIVTGVVEANILRSLFEGLVADDPSKDNAFPPGAATSWEHNADFTEWTFHLRPENRWSDGHPLTAEDFVFAYRRLLHPKFGGPYAEMLYFIKNAEAFNKGELDDFSQVGVSAADPYTLKLVLREPVPYLPGITRHYTWFPIPKHIAEPTMLDRTSPWTQGATLVSNGAFRLKSRKFNAATEVEKNPLYWGAAQVQLNGIRFLPIENFYTETRAFLAGQLHTTYRLMPDQVEAVKRDAPDCLHQEPYVGTRFVRFNTTRPALNDPKVRMALSLAIDRKQLCDTISKGNTPATSLTPRLGDYQPEPVLTFDADKARALLAEAGYPGGKGFPRYTLLTSSGGSRASAEALQAMWKDNLGILIDIRTMEGNSANAAQQRMDFDIGMAGWIGDYLDPTTFLLMWTKDNGNNNTGWSSTEYEALLAEAPKQHDPAQRLRILKQAELLFMKDQPIAPLSWDSRNYLHRPEVKGWHPLLLDNHPWKAVSIEP